MDQSPLTESLASLSKFFVGSATMGETLERVTELTLDALPPVHFAGITMMIEGTQRTAFFTDPAAPEIDQAQYDTGRGPCLESFATGAVIDVPSTADDDRWPEFCAAARDHGIGSTLSLPLIVDPEVLGALNLYAKEERAFDDELRDDASHFAAQAAIVVANSQAYWDVRDLSGRLRAAMESRATIEQAKGILMAAQRCGPDEAFRLLVRASQRENTKVRDLAARIVADASAGHDPDPASATP